MKDKERSTEIEKKDLTEIEHETVHPGEEEVHLKDSYAIVENNYLNKNTIGDID